MADTRQPELTLERFAALVEAYGGNVERFPAHERVAARALAQRSREAQQMLAGARALDALLASARAELPSMRLERELLKIPERHKQRRSSASVLPFRSRGRAALAAAAAVLLGVLSGGLSPSEGGDDPTSVEQAEIASLTFADDLFEALTDEGETE